LEDKCYFCGGQVKKRVITHYRQTEQGLVEFKGVPCEICEQCGEKYFSPQAVRKMESISKNKAQEFEKVPVYNYA
jgi:YgiT-type zinc finger domain-containing protein